MMYTHPNSYISLPDTHVLSPRFYTNSPFIPNRDSLYLQVPCSGHSSVFRAPDSGSRPASQWSILDSRHTATSATSNQIRRLDKNKNAMSLRALDWTIGRFNLSLKQLFVSLHLWRADTLSAAQVSDVFVRLATDFNATMATMASYGIFVESEFRSFEDRLRAVLEPSLNETPASPNFQNCIAGLEAVLADVLPKLASKQRDVTQMLVV